MAYTAIERIERQAWLDSVGEPVGAFVRRAYEQGGELGRRVKNAAHGTWLGHPLHPVLTDVPIGAWLTSAVLDATEDVTGDPGYGRAADVAIGFGLAGALGAAVTGLTDWSETDGGARRIGLLHGLMNLAATSLYATSLVLRRHGERAAGRGAGLAGLLVACTAAYLGGGLVYRDRVGVTHADEPQPEASARVLSTSDLPEGAMRQVDVRGTAVMVARCHGRTCALSEHCSHLGGPLSDGTLKPGSVVCPWHGSEFGLDDGHVINGPATHPQPVFRSVEREGSIYVGGAAD